MMEPDALMDSVIWSVEVSAEGAVKKKASVDPPLSETSIGVPEPPVEYVGALKSVTSATVVPIEPIGVMVHEISSLTRTIVVSPVVWPTQDSADAGSGIEPRTANENGLPVSGVVPVVNFSVMSRFDIDVELEVSANVNCVPPPTLLKVGVPEAPEAVYVGAVKSATAATAVPKASITLMVQEIASLM